MRNPLFIFLAILLLLTVSCREDNLNPNENQNDEVGVKLESLYSSRSSKLKREFARALIKSMNESPKLRELIKNEALKMFDKDYEVLIISLKERKVENGMSVEDLLNSNLQRFKLNELLQDNPALTILVPVLPENSFSAESWDTSNVIPSVAIRTRCSNDIPYFKTDGNEGIIEGKYIPGFPIVVVKDNERVVFQTDPVYSKLRSAVYKKNGFSYRFWCEEFDENAKSIKSPKINNRLTTSIDSKIITAYNIYNGTDGWQRDYIYYGISPSNPKGKFTYNYQEYVTSFSMNGDANIAYQKISDQTGDPYIVNNNNINSWTGGFYEFKVRTIINAKSGVGNELINGFTASPDKIFKLTYRQVSTFPKRYILDKIENNEMKVMLPLINWKLEDYATSIKIQIEEVDLSTTTVITDSRTVKFATNFEANTTIGEILKVGMKYGASFEDTQTHTVQRTFTQGNDDLGETIINFGDNVIIGKATVGSIIPITIYATRFYSSGFYNISVEPIRVQ